MTVETSQQTNLENDTWFHMIERLPECEHEDGVHTPSCLLRLTQLIFPEMYEDIAKIVSEYEERKKVAKEKELAAVKNEGGSFFASFVQFIRDELSWYASDESEVSKNEVGSGDFDQTSARITNPSNCQDEKRKTSNSASEETKDWNSYSISLGTSCGSPSFREERVSDMITRETQSENQMHSKVKKCDFGHGPIEFPIATGKISFKEAPSFSEFENDSNGEIESIYRDSRRPKANYVSVLAEDPKYDSGSRGGLKRTHECYTMQSAKYPHDNLVTSVESSYKRENDNKVHFCDNVENISNNSLIYNFGRQHSCASDLTRREPEVEEDTELNVVKEDIGVNGNCFEGIYGRYQTSTRKVESKGKDSNICRNTTLEVSNASESESYYSLEGGAQKSNKKKHSKLKSPKVCGDGNAYQNIIKKVRKLEQECSELGKKKEVKKTEIEIQKTKPEIVIQEVQKREREEPSIYFDSGCNKIKNKDFTSGKRNTTVRNTGNSHRFTERFTPYENDETPIIITSKTKRQRFKAKIYATVKKVTAPFRKIKLKKNLKWMQKLKIKRPKLRKS